MTLSQLESGTQLSERLQALQDAQLSIREMASHASQSSITNVLRSGYIMSADALRKIRLLLADDIDRQIVEKQKAFDQL